MSAGLYVLIAQKPSPQEKSFEAATNSMASPEGVSPISNTAGSASVDVDSSVDVATDSVYARLASYPFDDDREFQAGLAAILGGAGTPTPAAAGAGVPQRSDLVVQAQCFYFARYVRSRFIYINTDWTENSTYLQ